MENSSVKESHKGKTKDGKFLTTLIVDLDLWKKVKVEAIERGMKVYEFVNKALKNELNRGTNLPNELQDLSASISNTSEWYGWLPPICPDCNSPLSQKMASNRLVCLKCNVEYKLTKL